jgi:hypothetical protein
LFVPRESTGAQRSQEIWLARRCNHNVKWCVEETRISDDPLIHVACLLWHCLAETRAHRPRPRRPILTSPALLNTVLQFLSLYSCQYCMPVRPLTRRNRQNVRRIYWVAFCYWFSIISVSITFSPICHKSNVKTITLFWHTMKNSL